MVAFDSLHITLPHYDDFGVVSEIIESIECKTFFDFINICRHTPFKFYTYMGVSRVYLCPSNAILDINKNILMLMLNPM